MEEIERGLPVRILRFEILADSAGPGQYHGGAGVRLELLLLEGQAEADLLLPGRALGMQVLQNDPPRARSEGAGAFVDLQTLVDRSDILSLRRNC